MRLTFVNILYDDSKDDRCALFERHTYTQDLLAYRAKSIETILLFLAFKVVRIKYYNKIDIFAAVRREGGKKKERERNGARSGNYPKK